ncbi:hypothetical protein scyTo_0013298 [Scyliorhinus torazame]|uniref:E3 ubiquitin-protein ligase TRIM39-like n=1 Tax=Scyliorhinus torazame TaxID=75743 RepID=A0A401NTL1_SCYTO|nr:hypothetical protein [Scyliorhinus torazame]
MASRQQEESWTDEAICPICLDFFTDPVSLECGHNFCRSCIAQCWEKERNSCPECRQEFPERILRANRVLANLSEKAQKLKLNQKEKESKLHCEEHQEELKLFCETDKKLICVNCVDSQEHREHRFILIQKAVEIYKEEASRKRRISDQDNDLSLADGVLTFEKFNGPLPFPVWREMLDSINPVSVTLDIDTANPLLEVSEDLKSLRWTRTQRSLPDTGKRFKDCPCALGSEGFTMGRYYWEVEVTGNRGWRLGVAAESVEREGWISLSPATGFWTERSGDQFYIISSFRSPLPVGQIPGKVGVYLSYESGTVSFYNVDTKSHLHTFTGNKFTEKLYPFFWTWGENQFLRICSGSDPDPEKQQDLGVVTSP